MKTKYYLFILIALCLFSCGGKSHQSNKLETISINGNIRQALNFSSFVDTIEFIPLETNDENLIGDVERIIYRNGKYYIRTTQGMLHGKLSVFDKTGKYLWGLNRIGNGPGEYPELKEFAITENGNITASSYRKIINYDSTGVFLSENKTDFLGFEFVYTGNNNYFFLNRYTIEYGNKLFSVMDNRGIIKKRLFKMSKLEANKSALVHDWRDLSLFKSTLYFMYPYGDTIYAIDNKNNIKRLYSIDFGDKRIPADLFDEKGDELALEKRASKLEDYMHATAIGYADKYIYIGSYNKVFQGFITLYSKMNKHTLTAHKIIDDMFLKGNVIALKEKRLPHNMDGNDILWPLDPEYLINGYKHYMSYLSEAGREEFRKKYPELVKICTTLKEDDNPVILRIKVKDF